jgi:hypothetical protein
MVIYVGVALARNEVDAPIASLLHFRSLAMVRDSANWGWFAELKPPRGSVGAAYKELVLIESHGQYCSTL